MNRLLLTVAFASMLLAGCGGPKPSEPKSATGKEDSRIQRATSGGGASQQEMIKAPTGKAAE